MTVQPQAKNHVLTLLALTILVSHASGAAPKSNASPAQTPPPAPTGAPTGTTGASAPLELEKDFALACELTRATATLAEATPFKSDRADLVYRMTLIMTEAMHTKEAKDTYRAVTVADPKDRNELWNQSAKKLGIKGFTCKWPKYKP